MLLPNITLSNTSIEHHINACGDSCCAIFAYGDNCFAILAFGDSYFAIFTFGDSDFVTLCLRVHYNVLKKSFVTFCG